MRGKGDQVSVFVSVHGRNGYGADGSPIVRFTAGAGALAPAMLGWLAGWSAVTQSVDLAPAFDPETGSSDGTLVFLGPSRPLVLSVDLALLFIDGAWRPVVRCSVSVMNRRYASMSWACGEHVDAYLATRADCLAFADGLGAAVDDAGGVLHLSELQYRFSVRPLGRASNGAEMYVASAPDGTVVFVEPDGHDALGSLRRCLPDGVDVFDDVLAGLVGSGLPVSSDDDGLCPVASDSPDTFNGLPLDPCVMNGLPMGALNDGERWAGYGATASGDVLLTYSTGALRSPFVHALAGLVRDGSVPMEDAAVTYRYALYCPVLMEFVENRLHGFNGSWGPAIGPQVGALAKFVSRYVAPVNALDSSAALLLRMLNRNGIIGGRGLVGDERIRVMLGSAMDALVGFDEAAGAWLSSQSGDHGPRELAFEDMLPAILGIVRADFDRLSAS